MCSNKPLFTKQKQAASQIWPWANPCIHGSNLRSYKELAAQSCPTACNPMDCSPPGSSVHGLLQARILEWVAIPFFRGSAQPRGWIWVFCIASRFLYHLSHQGSLGIYTETETIWLKSCIMKAFKCFFNVHQA